MTFPAMGILISFPVLFVRGFGLDAYESITGLFDYFSQLYCLFGYICLAVIHDSF